MTPYRKRCGNPEKLQNNHIDFLWVWICPNLLQQLKFTSKYKHIQTCVENIFHYEFVIYLYPSMLKIAETTQKSIIYVRNLLKVVLPESGNMC